MLCNMEHTSVLFISPLIHQNLIRTSVALVNCLCQALRIIKRVSCKPRLTKIAKSKLTKECTFISNMKRAPTEGHNHTILCQPMAVRVSYGESCLCDVIMFPPPACSNYGRRLHHLSKTERSATNKVGGVFSPFFSRELLLFLNPVQSDAVQKGKLPFSVHVSQFEVARPFSSVSLPKRNSV